MLDELCDGIHEASAAMNDPARDLSALRVDAHSGLARLQPPYAVETKALP